MPPPCDLKQFHACAEDHSASGPFGNPFIAPPQQLAAQPKNDEELCRMQRELPMGVALCRRNHQWWRQGFSALLVPPSVTPAPSTTTISTSTAATASTPVPAASDAAPPAPSAPVVPQPQPEPQLQPVAASGGTDLSALLIAGGALLGTFVLGTSFAAIVARSREAEAWRIVAAADVTRPLAQILDIDRQLMAADWYKALPKADRARICSALWSGEELGDSRFKVQYDSPQHDTGVRILSISNVPSPGEAPAGVIVRINPNAKEVNDPQQLRKIRELYEGLRTKIARMGEKPELVDARAREALVYLEFELPDRSAVSARKLGKLDAWLKRIGVGTANYPLDPLLVQDPGVLNTMKSVESFLMIHRKLEGLERYEQLKPEQRVELIKAIRDKSGMTQVGEIKLSLPGDNVRLLDMRPRPVPPAPPGSLPMVASPPLLLAEIDMVVISQRSSDARHVRELAADYETLHEPVAEKMNAISASPKEAEAWALHALLQKRVMSGDEWSEALRDAASTMAPSSSTPTPEELERARVVSWLESLGVGDPKKSPPDVFSDLTATRAMPRLNPPPMEGVADKLIARLEADPKFQALSARSREEWRQRIRMGGQISRMTSAYEVALTDAQPLRKLREEFVTIYGEKAVSGLRVEETRWRRMFRAKP